MDLLSGDLPEVFFMDISSLLGTGWGGTSVISSNVNETETAIHVSPNTRIY